MSSKYLIILVMVSVFFLNSWTVPEKNWLSEKHPGYTVIYTSADKKNLQEYNKLIKNGIKVIADFFNSSYTREFSIYIHPGRYSLDSTWKKDWNMSDFKSECWMVASGVATKLDMISPQRWEKEACEHKYSETVKTQQLITHELVHVYHGQQNPSPDFSNVEGIDWFVEGLATYVSGQCDSIRIADVKKAMTDHKIPNSLDNFWTGKIKYGLSGSLVMFIDHQYGRAKLKALLPLTKKSEVLSSLNTTESDLLTEWEKYMRSL